MTPKVGRAYLQSSPPRKRGSTLISLPTQYESSVADTIRELTADHIASTSAYETGAITSSPKPKALAEPMPHVNVS